MTHHELYKDHKCLVVKIFFFFFLHNNCSNNSVAPSEILIERVNGFTTLQMIDKAGVCEAWGPTDYVCIIEHLTGNRLKDLEATPLA